MPQSMPDKRKGHKNDVCLSSAKRTHCRQERQQWAFGYHLGWFTQKWYPFRHRDLADLQTRSSSLAPLFERRQVQERRFQ